jgi:ribonuclease BN (tRNA processing enzyme)
MVAERRHGGAVELRVLGASGSWPAPAQPTSGYLVTESGFALWLELGTGTFARLQEVMSPLDIGALVVTHGHPDHFVDLYAAFYQRFFHPDRLPPLPLFCPPGLFDAVTCHAPSSRAQEMRAIFDVREVAPGQSVEIGPFSCSTYGMRHDPTTIGLRVRAGDHTLAYTADTGPTEDILSLADGADVLLCEATWLDGQGRAPNHLSAREAGEFGRRAGAGSLVLTHLWPRFDPEDARREAERSFGHDVLVAHSGLAIDVGNS